MLDLIHAGNLQPTAQQVADHAKVGIRSVFRHFEDMESIFASVDKLVRKESHALYGNKSLHWKPSGSASPLLLNNQQKFMRLWAM